jgi:anti-anti-sigma factor
VEVPAELRCSHLAGTTRSGQTAMVLLEVHGDLDKALVARMRETLFSAAASSPERIVIDMAAVSFVDAVGLRTLIAARRRCAAAGTGFALRRPSRAVRRLLSVTHLDNVFDVEQERRSA